MHINRISDYIELNTSGAQRQRNEYEDSEKLTKQINFILVFIIIIIIGIIK